MSALDDLLNPNNWIGASWRGMYFDEIINLASIQNRINTDRIIELEKELKEAKKTILLINNYVSNFNAFLENKET